MTDSRTILYIAASETAACDGAAAIERAATDDAPISVTVEPIATTMLDLEAVRERAGAPDVDCIVFAETPTTAEGASLLEVSDACGETPLALFTDAAYGPTAARSTDGVDGYVRRDDDADAFDHLLDEVIWLIDETERADRPRPALPAPDDPSDGLLEALPDGVFTVDSDGRVTYANDWMGELLGIESERVRGVPLSALATTGTVSAADADALEAAVERVLETEDDGDEVRPITLPITVTNGTRRSVTLRISARGDEAVVTVRPIDDRIGSDSTLEWFPEPAVRYDVVDGTVVVRAVNSAFATVFDVDCEAIVGDGIDDVGLYGVGERLRDALEVAGGDGGRRADDHHEFSSRHRTGDGVREFVVTVVPALAPTDDRHRRGTESGAVARFTDVTDRKHRDRERTARTDRLEEIAEIAGYELRNPLNVARGYLELVTETGEREHIAEVEAAHERIETLVERVRTLARHDDPIGITEPVAIHDSARRAWSDVEAEVGAIDHDHDFEAESAFEFDSDSEADSDSRPHLRLERDGILDADRLRLIDLLEIVFRYAIERGSSTSNGTLDDDDASGDEDRSLTIRVGATEDGFYVAADGPRLPEDSVVPTVDSDTATPTTDACADLRLVEEIVDAHGWSTSITGCETGGIRLDVTDVQVTGLEPVRDDPTSDAGDTASARTTTDANAIVDEYELTPERVEQTGRDREGADSQPASDSERTGERDGPGERDGARNSA